MSFVFSYITVIEGNGDYKNSLNSFLLLSAKGTNSVVELMFSIYLNVKALNKCLASKF